MDDKNIATLKHRSQHYRRLQWKIMNFVLLGYVFYYAGRLNFSFAIIGLNKAFNLNTIHTGMIGAVMLVAYGLGQAVNGVLGDIFSSRRLFTLGAILSFIFNWLSSFATGFWTLLIPWALNGYAQSFGFAPCTKIVANWWEEKDRGITFGLLLFSSGISSIVAFGICIVVSHYLTWQWIFRIPVIFTLLAAGLLYLNVKDSPEELGYQNQYPIHQNKQSKLIKFKDLIRVINNLPFLIACLSMGFASIARYGLLFWVPVYFMKLSHQDVWLTLALPTGMALGSLLSGYWSDKIFKDSQGNTVALMMIIATFFVFILYEMPSSYNFLTLFTLFLAGFFIYGPQTPLFALCPKLLGVRYTSTGVGIMNACAYALSAIGELFIGYAIHRTNQVGIIFTIVAIACLLSAILGLLIKPFEYQSINFTAVKK